MEQDGTGWNRVNQDKTGGNRIDQDGTEGKRKNGWNRME